MVALFNHYGNYSTTGGEIKWGVMLQKLREIRGMKREKEQQNLTTGYIVVKVQQKGWGCQYLRYEGESFKATDSNGSVGTVGTPINFEKDVL